MDFNLISPNGLSLNVFLKEINKRKRPCDLFYLSEFDIEAINSLFISIPTLKEYLENEEFSEFCRNFLGDRITTTIKHELYNFDFFIYSDENMKSFKDSIIHKEEELIISYKKFRLNGSLSGVRFCIGGPLSKPRKYYQTLLNNKNAFLDSKITEDTNYLIVGKIDKKIENNEKFKLAKTMGITIIDEENFLLLFL